MIEVDELRKEIEELKMRILALELHKDSASNPVPSYVSPWVPPLAGTEPQPNIRCSK